MRKRILILGGSYFIGRVFSIMADKSGQYDISLVNRGRFPLKRPSIREYVFDRRDPALQTALKTEEPWDALVDFCAYEEGDGRIITLLKDKIRQYIGISSCAVFAPSRELRNEESPFLTGPSQNPAEEYALKKMRLEGEIRDVCASSGLPYTILRPCFVFGPFNYALRESFYFKRMLEGCPIPHPFDSRSEFSFVYVRDTARAIMASAGNPRAYHQSFNLAGPERISYRVLLEVLRFLVGKNPLPVEEITTARALEEQIPLPFPLDQNELFDGTMAEKMLGLRYTGFREGMEEAFS
ncbi:MAG: NAD-dependent epimerase/dehydratase family protein, partial [Treponema sp.]|nr:NAD-dependent epimerase/dehydratase family protein [Treponema sp.]